MIIGLTGGIATGKSTVSSLLVRRGAHLVDADQIAREVVEPGSPVLNKVAERFGQAVLLDDGSLNRKELGAIVFNDASARKDLEALLHPPIRALIKKRMNSYDKQDPEGLTVVDIPLLYESRLDVILDFSEIMVVYVPVSIQLERLSSRDNLTEDEARKRLAAQMDIEDKKRRADIVIDNSGTLQQTEEQLDEFWRRKGLP
jgi:dephospho-CoA kinase